MPVSSKNTPKPAMDVDSMLEHAGDFHRYQVLLMVLFSFINILSAFDFFAQLFIFIAPQAYFCKLPDMNWETLSDETLNLGPADGKCFHYNVTQTTELVDTDQPRVDNLTLEACQSGWHYNLTSGYQSIISELDWVCEDDWKPVLAQSLYFVGSVFGTLGLGIMADHIGRLHVVVIANMISFVGNMATAFAKDLTQLSICRVFAGLANDCNFVMMYIIVLEYMRPSRRTLGLNLCIGVFHTLGCLALPWIATSLGNWRHFMMVISVPFLFVPFFYFLVPESAQWLISKGRVDEAVKNFKRIAKINRKHIHPETYEEFEKCSKLGPNQVLRTPSLLGLFRTPCLRRKTLILIFKSMVLTLCFDAISRNVGHSGFTPFTVFTITSITKLPASLVILALQDRMGRKGMASSSLLMSGLFTAAAGLVIAFHKGADPVLISCLAVVGRFGVNIAYSSGAQYAAELIPTEVRGQGVAAIHMVGYAATFFSSHILYLAHYWRPLPELVLGILSIIGAALCLLLPETLHRALPVTLEDGEAFGEDEKVWDFACCKPVPEKKFPDDEPIAVTSNTVTTVTFPRTSSNLSSTSANEEPELLTQRL